MLYEYNKLCNVALLSEEIEASTITIALSEIFGDETTTSVQFKAELSTEEKTELDTLITNHDVNNYVAPTVDPILVKAEFSKEEDDTKIPYVYASPRPMNHYSYFTMVGDTEEEIGGGDKILFNMSASDVSKELVVSFNEDVYLKDGLILARNAPFGATVDMEVHHPLAGLVVSFCKKVPVFSDYPIELNTEDRAFIPKGLLIKIIVRNSSGTNGEDSPCDFGVIGRLELFRPSHT